MKQLYIYLLLLSISLTFQNCFTEDSVSIPDHSFSGEDTTDPVAQFAIVGDFLYTVSNSSLKTFNISTPSTPVLSNEIGVGGDVENIISLAGKLLIKTSVGTRIFNIEADGSPNLISNYNDIKACDSFTSNGQYAYVSIGLYSECRSNVTTGEIQVFDITNILNPTLVTTYPMGNPKGIEVSGNTLFVCDLHQGFTVLDVTNPLAITQLAQIVEFPSRPSEVIVLDDIAIGVSSSKIYQYDYSDLNNINLISTFSL